MGRKTSIYAKSPWRVESVVVKEVERTGSPFQGSWDELCGKTWVKVEGTSDCEYEFKIKVERMSIVSKYFGIKSDSAGYFAIEKKVI